MAHHLMFTFLEWVYVCLGEAEATQAAAAKPGDQR